MIEAEKTSFFCKALWSHIISPQRLLQRLPQSIGIWAIVRVPTTKERHGCFTNCQSLPIVNWLFVFELLMQCIAGFNFYSLQFELKLKTDRRLQRARRVWRDIIDTWKYVPPIIWAVIKQRIATLATSILRSESLQWATSWLFVSFFIFPISNGATSFNWAGAAITSPHIAG